jgi:hypothetical protein
MLMAQHTLGTKLVDIHGTAYSVPNHNEKVTTAHIGVPTSPTMHSLTALLRVGLFTLSYSTHLLVAASTSLRATKSILGPSNAVPLPHLTYNPPVPLRECQDFRFSNSVLFATCASERTFVNLNRCMGNLNGILVYKTE